MVYSVLILFDLTIFIMMHCGCGRLLLLVVGITVQAPSNVGAAAADEYGPYGKCEEKGCGKCDLFGTLLRR